MRLRPVTPTLGRTLERQRLEHRIRRATLVLAALRDRSALRSTRTGSPSGLADAVRDFSAELSRLDRRPNELRRRQR
jgi:hypothetical protein